MKFLTKKNQSGFTIIEVMIVLAIAGVMIAAVLIAVPQLQRNQRNSSRKAILGRIKTEIDNYSGNNNGNIPTNDANATTGITGGFQTRYITPNANSLTDPQTGTVMAMNARTAIGTGTGTAVGTVNYTTTAICAGEVATATGATARNYAIVTLLEGAGANAASYCLDNR